ncbi:MAG: dipeptidyl aminopeptidase [Betaproteobacteria bacterium]|nr:MAG: dipeptidyl aminopeptidase [Betaproteobacteria bacterium]
MTKFLMNRLLRALRLTFSLLLCAPFYSSYAADLPPQIVHIPVEGPGTLGSDARMVAGLFLPAGDGPFAVVVYSHGRSGTDLERSFTKIPDVRGHVRYWLKKGFAVVAAIRPGYGETGGVDREDSGVRYDVFGNCWGQPDFAHSAAAATTAILATLTWVRQQPWADPGRIVLVGASMGGLASIASAATNPDGVVAYINFSGGTGGNGKRAPEHSCGSEAMEALMPAYGKTTRVPSLWLYAQNDSYWGADWPRAWHRAYATHDSPTQFVMTDAVPNADGHQLLARGSRLWSVHVDRFLEELGF